MERKKERMKDRKRVTKQKEKSSKVERKEE